MSTSPSSTPTQEQPFLQQQSFESSTPLSSTSPPATASNHVNAPTRRPTRSTSSSFPATSSPLSPFGPNSRSRPGSMHLAATQRFASEESANNYPTQSSRGSLVLYRLADLPSPHDSLLPPPKLATQNRDSVFSTSGDSIASLSNDSKYPIAGASAAATAAALFASQRGVIPYAYDPIEDENNPLDEEDYLHDPSDAWKRVPDTKGGGARIYEGRGRHFPWRGIFNVGMLLLLLLALMMLFIFYPVLTALRDAAKNRAIEGNIRINGTGQVPVLFQMPEMVDLDTPDDAKSRTGFDGEEYELVFSDEFNRDGRTFYPGDDPFWEAVDLWYGVTADLEWYDPAAVTTRDGKLVITMTDTGAPTLDKNHNLQYRSGMLQSWNKFCFSSGYIEVSVTFPGPNENTQGYWPGVWTMGNLGRPGYPATTDGLWPYTYDTCDVGTFPNQTLKDRSGPAAALRTEEGRSKYNYELSWLPGQRLSACGCPDSDHPGPVYNRGRGAPEIDVLEAERSKLDTLLGQVVSQSAQFAPFTHDYLFNNASTDEYTIFDTSVTQPNTYRGSAIQQAVSSLTRVPSDMFDGLGDQKKFATLGFEYWADKDKPEDGFITWQVDGKPSHQMRASAMGPDADTQVGQRLVPVEPMSLVLNLGISKNWQTIDLTTMTFPTEMLIDYVRVYQRKGHTQTSCDPKDYPTKTYIDSHLEAYMNPNLTAWPWEKPKNSLYDGGC